MNCFILRREVLLWCFLLLLPKSAGYSFDEYNYSYAGAIPRRAHYYLKKAGLISKNGLKTEDEMQACKGFLEAAIDIQHGNLTLLEMARATGCFSEDWKPQPDTARSTFKVGPLSDWANKGQPGDVSKTLPKEAKKEDLFSTPIGFVHLSELGLKDWKKTLRFFYEKSVAHYSSRAESLQMKEGGHVPLSDINSDFFEGQNSIVEGAMEDPSDWPDMYKSDVWKEWIGAVKRLCGSFGSSVAPGISEHSFDDNGISAWAAVYPDSTPTDESHHAYHSHDSSLISLVLFVSNPGHTPLVLGDPRGLHSNEEYSYDHHLDVDGASPFHRPMEFFAGEGDIILFPSYVIHKVPGNVPGQKHMRVAWPANCALTGWPMDAWEKVATWKGRKNVRPSAAQSYILHAQAGLNYSFMSPTFSQKQLELKRAALAAIQMAPESGRIWLEAGKILFQNVGLSDGDNYDEANYEEVEQVFTRAVNLDKGLWSELRDWIKSISDANKHSKLHLAYKKRKSVKKFKEYVRRIRFWSKQGNPPFEPAVTAFSAKPLNGPGECTGAKLCQSMAIKPMWSTEIHMLKLTDSAAEADQIVALASELLNGNKAILVSTSTPVDGHWKENISASLSVVVCDASAEVWLADARGRWPEHFTFRDTIRKKPLAAKASLEPKSPFHYHHVQRCSSGEAVLLPGWLSYQVPKEAADKIRSFAVILDPKLGHSAWRYPHPQTLNNDVDDRNGKSEL
eukprot:TRINITY_DN10278_c0_g2_i1.p1 TRINITY_DN10278_c0_g2~~TRINITY_DN10278_c0_g2_i1.p1  ORF type:complete len:733 (+),score=109.15 TRINITY_DN10278_c0_g2_i1:136-2334(+)